MKKRVIIILLSILTILAIILGVLLSNKNKELKENQIKIMDATVVCKEQKEKFYEDDKFTYSFKCANSSGSIFVKLANGKKMLVVDALEEEEVTIKELIDAGLDVIKTKR